MKLKIAGIMLLCIILCSCERHTLPSSSYSQPLSDSDSALEISTTESVRVSSSADIESGANVTKKNQYSYYVYGGRRVDS